ncbi:MAG: hypothetical protein ACM3SY_07220 [Candidatus Omnitrophota bacterium]
MLDKADVYIKNVSFQGLNAFRRFPDGRYDSKVDIDSGSETMIPLQGTDISLVINTPAEKDLKDCPILVKSDVDLEVMFSRTNSNWSIKIVPNDLPPGVPTTVNVDVGATGQ